RSRANRGRPGSDIYRYRVHAAYIKHEAISGRIAGVGVPSRARSNRHAEAVCEGKAGLYVRGRLTVGNCRRAHYIEACVEELERGWVLLAARLYQRPLQAFGERLPVRSS